MAKGSRWLRTNKKVQVGVHLGHFLHTVAVRHKATIKGLRYPYIMNTTQLFLSGGTHRLLGSSFLGLPYRILYINHRKELLRSLWVVLREEGSQSGWLKILRGTPQL